MNTVAEQKARLLEARTAENTDTIEQLRHERSQLASEHKHLLERYREANEVHLPPLGVFAQLN